MSKHLTLEQWIKLFEIYENDRNLCWFELSKFKKITRWSQEWFSKKYTMFICNNKDMNVLMSKTGKSPKKGKGVGRPKNSKNKHTIWKEFLRDIGEDEIAKIIGELVDEENEGVIKKIKQIINKTKMSSRKLESILHISKSKICYLRKNAPLKSHSNRKNEWLKNVVYEIFRKRKNRVGRKQISRIILKKYGILYSDRHIGRIMAENYIKCEIRKARRQKEFKNTNVIVENIVLRDYDNIKHDNEIFATDVTYIPATKDCNQNHVFLSAIISHKTKEIVGWKLSKTNDTRLVLDSFQNLITKQIKNVIVHSDHGLAYSSLLFSNMLAKNNWTQSMSRVGNSLDNRVIEFWFSILKTELIYNLNIKEMSFNELEEIIKNFIEYYNNVRMQEKLLWMTPSEYSAYLQ